MDKGYTFVKKHKIVYEWNIKKISSHLKKIEGDSTTLKSSEFSTGAKINDKWRLELHLNNGTSPVFSEKCISLFLHNLNDYSVPAVVEFAIFDHEQSVVYENGFKRIFKIKEKLGSRKLMSKHLLKIEPSLIPDDILTIHTTVIVYDNVSRIPLKSSLNPSEGPMVDDYRKLYKNKKNTDVTIVVGNKEFQAHKQIIMARSPVLKSMITHALKEGLYSKVNIEDISPEIFKQVLEYIYTDEVINLDDDAFNLLEAARKYQLLSLEKFCEHSLCTTLRYGNVVKRLILADRHKAKQLLDYVTECIMVDASNVIERKDFKMLEKSSLGFLMFQEIASCLNINNSTISYSS
ncbi:speckle-type POZ protein-like [Microplitis mediator]|uniref:speckle-type POZ protein-like n=1 Tax=Microplitis mediator TaxID=375433 RepID=UPI00255227DF|nr:speckle-type POZ protein-like [Microplitis mediator]